MGLVPCLFLPQRVQNRSPCLLVRTFFIYMFLFVSGGLTISTYRLIAVRSTVVIILIFATGLRAGKVDTLFTGCLARDLV